VTSETNPCSLYCWSRPIFTRGAAAMHAIRRRSVHAWSPSTSTKPRDVYANSATSAACRNSNLVRVLLLVDDVAHKRGNGLTISILATRYRQTPEVHWYRKPERCFGWCNFSSFTSIASKSASATARQVTPYSSEKNYLSSDAVRKLQNWGGPLGRRCGTGPSASVNDILIQTLYSVTDTMNECAVNTKH